MKTSKHIEQCTQLTNSSPAPTGGFFIPDIFPGKIRAGLTKVNKPAITHLLSITSKSIIFPMVKRPLSIVNKIVVFATQN